MLFLNSLYQRGDLVLHCSFAWGGGEREMPGAEGPSSVRVALRSHRFI